MSVTGVSNLVNSSYTTETKDKTSLDKDDFLTLLLAQMQNQDPLNPQDSTEYLSQLAQLSSLESLQNIDESLYSLGIAQMAGTNSQAVSYIGKTVKAAGQDVTVNSDGEVTAEMLYDLGENAESCDITITNADGDIVKVIKAGSKEKGEHSVEWDGTDENGNKVPAGEYHFDVAAVNSDGDTIDSAYYTKGEVTGITYENGYPELYIGGVKIVLGNVVEVSGDSKVVSEEAAIKYKLAKIEQYFTANAANKNVYNVSK